MAFIDESREKNIRLILGECQRQLLTDFGQRAYILATVQHETAGTYRPIEEWASGDAYEPPSQLARTLGNTEKGDGRRYKGRGYVQLTGRANYLRYSKITGRDLIGQPHIMLDPHVSAFVLVDGMRYGRFTGRRLGMYIWGDVRDYVQARRIINGLDKAELIASYAREWENRVGDYDGI